MKRWLLLASCGVLALGLAACSTALPYHSPPQANASAGKEAMKATALEWEEMYSADLDGDGQTENFILKIPDACPDEGAPENLRITVGNENEGETHLLTEGFHSGPCYLLETEQGARLLLNAETRVGHGAEILFSFHGWQPVELERISGWAMRWNEQEESIRIQDTIDVLGTWEAERSYQLIDDRLVPLEGSLWEIRDTDQIITLRAPLAVELRQEDGSYQFADLEAGTEMKVRATDCDRIVVFQLRNGVMGRFTIDGFQNGGVIIEGKMDGEYFEKLPYSG